MKFFSRDKSKHGSFNYVNAILLFLLAGGIIYGYFLIPVYYSDFAWKREVQKQIRNAEKNSDQKIRADLTQLAEKLKIPLASTDMTVVRYAGKIQISYKYEITTPLPFFRQRAFQAEHIELIKKVFTLGPD